MLNFRLIGMGRKKIKFLILVAAIIMSGFLISFRVELSQAATRSGTLSELEQKKKAEEAKATKARELKEKKEQQAQNAKHQASFLEGQIQEIKKEEDKTQVSVNKTEGEIGQLKSDIQITEQSQALVKRRTQEAAKAYFKERRKKSIDLSGGELDILVGDNLSESSSDEAKFEALAGLLRKRMAEFIVAKVNLNNQKDVAEDKYAQLSALKREQESLRKSKIATQTKYSRLASFSEAEATKYEQEMEEALRNAAYWEKKILDELTRIINARKSGNIPRTGAGVGQKVRQGEVVGHQGNTGYSFGSHLHLEIRLNNTPVNPRNYLGGTLSWPLDPEFRTTQEFGVTPYSKNLYSSGIHTGLDLAKYDGANVSAACSGEIILDASYGGYGRAFAHTCDNTDLVVLYGHLQPE